MIRKYDTIAICLLIFSVVLLCAISVDPKGFTLRDWQPLMAAILTLGGAGIVYRGAMLAYRAAMAKVDFDREVNARESRRLALGVCLRLDYALKVLVYEAENTRLSSVTTTPASGPKTIKLDEVVFSRETETDEAWNNLDRFPRQLAQYIGEVRGSLYDFSTLQEINKGTEFTIRHYHQDPPEIARLKQYLGHIAQQGRAAREQLQQHILALEQ
jgi:hypothetical protein